MNDTPRSEALPALGASLDAEKATASVLPVLPLEDAVLFPYTALSVTVRRESSIKAVEAALNSEDPTIVVAARRSAASVDEPTLQDLHSVGTLAIIRQMARKESGIFTVLIGVDRVILEEAEQGQPYLCAKVRRRSYATDRSPEVEALRRSVLEVGQRMFDLNSSEVEIQLERVFGGMDDPMVLTYFLGSTLDSPVDKQRLLEQDTCLEALRTLHALLVNEVRVLEIREEISRDVRKTMGEEHKKHLLRRELRAIREELEEESPEGSELRLLEQRVKEAELPAMANLEAERELQRLERLPAASLEYQVTRSYLEFILELPWNQVSEERIELKQARQILDEDHHGLTQVKERILEHLAVMKLNPQAHAPILCFVGPPGVGKTSLGQSIARAIGRQFQRMSLGAMHDEAEMRGHRRTYVGAMPGRILQAIRRAGVKNPLLMLDEVDKMGRDFRGDPAAALLEILDPEQNDLFRDNYLDLPFDLSKVFFITTANTLDAIPQPLLDRMEVLRLPGYSREEKLEIATRYLVPRQFERAGLPEGSLVLPKETLDRVAARYTREAGVRELERCIGRIARKFALQLAEGESPEPLVRPEDVLDLLGPERFQPEQVRRELPAGVAPTLAWTQAGGDVLYVEAIRLPGKDELLLTGSLGDVMRESARAAHSFVRSHAAELEIEEQAMDQGGVHVHVPAGAVQKDGPSAGVAMATALASLYTERPVRSDTAMTGEITLSGLVLPVGGIKEKILAAHRVGLKRIILPKDNEGDLREIPSHVSQDLSYVLVSRVEELLRAALMDAAGAESDS